MVAAPEVVVELGRDPAVAVAAPVPELVVDPEVPVVATVTEVVTGARAATVTVARVVMETAARGAMETLAREATVLAPAAGLSHKTRTNPRLEIHPNPSCRTRR